MTMGYKNREQFFQGTLKECDLEIRTPEDRAQEYPKLNKNPCNARAMSPTAC